MHAGGQRFESVILHKVLEKIRTKFIDILELIEVVNKKSKTKEFDKLQRAHGGCLGSERRRRT